MVQSPPLWGAPHPVRTHGSSANPSVESNEAHNSYSGVLISIEELLVLEELLVPMSQSFAQHAFPSLPNKHTRGKTCFRLSPCCILLGDLLCVILELRDIASENPAFEVVKEDEYLKNDHAQSMTSLIRVRKQIETHPSARNAVT